RIRRRRHRPARDAAAPGSLLEHDGEQEGRAALAQARGRSSLTAGAGDLGQVGESRWRFAERLDGGQELLHVIGIAVGGLRLVVGECHQMQVGNAVGFAKGVVAQRARLVSDRSARGSWWRPRPATLNVLSEGSLEMRKRRFSSLAWMPPRTPMTKSNGAGREITPSSASRRQASTWPTS